MVFDFKVFDFKIFILWSSKSEFKIIWNAVDLFKFQENQKACGYLHSLSWTLICFWKILNIPKVFHLMVASRDELFCMVVSWPKGRADYWIENLQDAASAIRVQEEERDRTSLDHTHHYQFRFSNFWWWANFRPSSIGLRWPLPNFPWKICIQLCY